MSELAEAIEKVVGIIKSSNSDDGGTNSQDLSSSMRCCVEVSKQCGFEPVNQHKDEGSLSALMQRFVELILFLLRKTKEDFGEDFSCWSMSRSNNISYLLQFAIKFGVHIHLEPNVGVHKKIPSRELTSFYSLRQRTALLLKNCMGIMTCCENVHIRNIFVVTSLIDIICALMQLCFSPACARVLDFSERKQCLKQLNLVLESWISKNRAVREILMLQGNLNSRVVPKWCQEKCAVMLTKTLLEKNGVIIIIQSIVQNFFVEGNCKSSGGEWERATSLSSIISTLPSKQISADKYCQLVCPQLVELLTISRKEINEVSQNTSRISVATLHALFKKYPSETTSHLVQFLTLQLNRCCISANTDFAHDVTEEDLSNCVENLHQICLSYYSEDFLVTALIQPYLLIFFLLICDTRQTSSHLSSLSMDLINTCLKSVEPEDATKLILQLYGEESPPETMKIPFQNLFFSMSSSGGIIPEIREIREPTEILACQDIKVEVLLSIVKNCNMNEVIGNVFIELIKSLCDPVKNIPSRVNDTGQLMTEDDRAKDGLKSNETRLITFALLTALCETIEPNTLLSNPTQIFSFIQITLEHHLANLTTNSMQSLNTCMSVLGLCLLSDLTSEQKETLRGLAPLLQKLASSEVIDEHTKEMICNLSIAISTFGSLDQASFSLLSKTLQDQANLINDSKLMNNANTDKNTTIFPQSESQDKTTIKDDKINYDDRERRPLKGKTTEKLPDNQSVDSPNVRYATDNIHQNCSSNNKRRECPSNMSSESMFLQSFEEAINESSNPSPALQGGAIRYLTKCLQQKVSEALKRQDELIGIFWDGLNHLDSYVYLSAVQGLSVVASGNTKISKELLERLISDFLSNSHVKTNNQDAALKYQPIDVRMKCGEVIMRIIKQMGDMAPYHASLLLPEFLRGARDTNPDMRASCLSNIAEIAPLAPYSMQALQYEIKDCLCAISRTDDDVMVRRAAVHAIHQMIAKLQKRFIRVFHDVVKHFYRTLKTCYEKEDDTGVQLHAQLALEELDELMKSEIFDIPEFKKKITILPM